MELKRVGLDLAKNVFQVHGVDGYEVVRCRRQLRRSEVLKFFAGRPPCLIGMEACAGAHYWARELAKLGHTVKLMAPQLVKPYVTSQKNDANDADGICEAVGRPKMRFVAVKTVAQQEVQAAHRIRSELIRHRTAKVNQIRGLLAEFGLVVGRRIEVARMAALLFDLDPSIRLLAADGAYDQLAELISEAGPAATWARPARTPHSK